MPSVELHDLLLHLLLVRQQLGGSQVVAVGCVVVVTDLSWGTQRGLCCQRKWIYAARTTVDSSWLSTGRRCRPTLDEVWGQQGCRVLRADEASFHQIPLHLQREQVPGGMRNKSTVSCCFEMNWRASSVKFLLRKRVLSGVLLCLLCVYSYTYDSKL